MTHDLAPKRSALPRALTLVLTVLAVLTSGLVTAGPAAAIEEGPWQDPTIRWMWHNCDWREKNRDLSEVQRGPTVPWPIPADWQPVSDEDRYYAHQDQDFAWPFQWHPEPTGSTCFDAWQRVVGLQWPTAADVLPVGRTIRPRPRCADRWAGRDLQRSWVLPEEAVLAEDGNTFTAMCAYDRVDGYTGDTRDGWVVESKQFVVRTVPVDEVPHLTVSPPARPLVGEAAAIGVHLADPAAPHGVPTGLVELVDESGEVVDDARIERADLGRTTLETGVLDAGPHRWTVTYGGDDDFEPTSGHAELVAKHDADLVVPPHVRVRPGRPTHIDALVTSESPDLSGTFTVSEGGIPLGESDVAADGSARVTLPTAPPEHHDLTVSWSGNDVTWDDEAAVSAGPQEWLTRTAVQVREHGLDGSTTDWADAPGADEHPVRDGNPIRLEVDVTNPTDEPARVPLDVVGPDGAPVPDAARTVAVAPGHTETVHVTLDTTGLAWDGTAPRVQAQFRVRLRTPDGDPAERSETLRVVPVPVVLVHGWNSSAAGWDGYQELLRSSHPLLEAYAVGDGQAPGIMNTGNVFAPGPTRTMAQNAREEATYVEGVRRITGSTQVDVVAHSMGGLITREYVADRMPLAPDGDPVVRHLVQMGTPNMGSPSANRLVELSVLALDPYMFPQPSTYQLTTTFAEEHNRAYPRSQMGDVRLSNLVGTGIPLPGGMPVDSDGVVPTWSAAWDLPPGDRPEHEIAHTSMTDSAQLVTSYVVPRLAANGPVGSSRTTRAAGAEPDASGDQTVGGVSLVVPAGATRTRPLAVPPGSRAGLLGMAPGLEVELVDERGEVVDRAEAPLGAASPWVGVSGDPGAGATWTVRVHNAGPSPARADLALWVRGNPAEVAVTRAEVGPEGHAVVTARLDGVGGPAPAELGGQLVGDSTAGTPVTLARRADGTYAWTGRLRGSAEGSGETGVAVVADLDGQGRRVDTAPFEVVPTDPRGPGGTTPVPPGRAPSSVVARATHARSARPVVVVRVSARGPRPTGTVRVVERGRLLKRATLTTGATARVRLPILRPGRHRLVVHYAGSTTVAPASAVVVVRTRRGPR